MTNYAKRYNAKTTVMAKGSTARQVQAKRSMARAINPRMARCKQITRRESGISATEPKLVA